MQMIRNTKGFTLVELLVALIVTSVILAAVATLAFAVNTASNAGDDTALSQTRFRQTTLRCLDLIRDAKLICAAPGNDLVVWRADDNANNAIDVNEVVYMERGADRTMLRLCRFDTVGSHQATLNELADADTKALLIADYDEEYTTLIPDCKGVSFVCHRDGTADPIPRTKRVTISLDLMENSSPHHYEIDATLRGWAGHLLDTYGTALVARDDD